jgi:type VI secretion system secreted protein Hcp
VAIGDFFLKLDGIEGESQDKKHKGEIDITSFSVGVSQGGTFSTGGGGGAGKADFQDIHFTKVHDKSSPKLLAASSSGQHISKAVLTCRKAGGEQEEYLKLEFGDVLISGFQFGASSGGDSTIMDQFSLNYGKIIHEYKEQTAKGSLGGSVKAGWNLKENAKI